MNFFDFFLESGTTPVFPEQLAAMYNAMLQVCCVICCGPTQTRTCRVGARTTGACRSRSGRTSSVSSSTDTTLTSSVERIR